MTILLAKAQYREDFSRIIVSGEQREEVGNLLISALLRADYEVFFQTEEGELVGVEDYLWPEESEDGA